ncbi:MAG: fimbrillin family protein [Bacteroides sp.]|nr:fimbrillin family protein [Bacteroides sp.]MCM1378496.1 fimbrillin family protein [Bacteroides sp.]MCM1444797.1 fimbrillin family protein [Prevotella sp.]
MSKQLTLGLMAAAALLTGCSQDEVLNMSADSNVIRVGANTTSASRALDSYCPEVLPAQFYLTAVHEKGAENQGIYFSDALLNHASGNEYGFAGSDYYWPDNALDFYAYHCTNDVNFELTANENDSLIAKFVDFQVPSDVASQADLLYASTFGAAKAGGSVHLDFRHALSQVTFSAKVENENIRVEISEVGMTNLLDKATFVFPDTTDAWSPNMMNDIVKNLLYTDTTGDSGVSTPGGNNASQNGYGTQILGNQGILGGWQVENVTGDENVNVKRVAADSGNDGAIGGATLSGSFPHLTRGIGTAEYNIDLSANPVKLVANAVEGDESWLTGIVPLTAAPSKHIAGEGYSPDWSKVMQLLPQFSDYCTLVNMKRSPARRITTKTLNETYYKANALKIKSLTTCPVPYNQTMVYIRLACKITTINESDGKEIVLFDSYKTDETKYVYLPLSIYWEPGYRYLYTIKFTEHGNGGITNPEDPDDVLSKISITADVSEYNEAGMNVTDDFEYSVSDEALEELVDGKR